MSSGLYTSSATQHPANALSNHQAHEDSTDEDDDGGVAIFSNTTSPLLNGENIQPHLALEQQQAHNLAHIEAGSGAASIPTFPDNPFDPSVPTAMSQLSHQLAQIQQAQGSDNEAEMVGHIASVHQYSTPPAFPFLPYSPTSLIDFYIHQEEEEISQGNDFIQVEAFGIMHPPPMAETYNAPAPIIDYGHLEWGLSSDFESDELGFWGPADLAQVDVEQNSHTLSMYDFLWTWGHGCRMSAMNKKKLQGPNLGSLQRQRKTTPKYVDRSDLQGDHYDIQGIDWVDMEVTRQEARRERRVSYKNYESIPSHLPYGNKIKKVG